MTAPRRAPTAHEQLQDGIVTLLAYTGWKHLHVRRSVGHGKKWTTTTNVKGWPDLFCWSPRQPGRFLAIEVKIPGNGSDSVPWKGGTKVAPDQAELLAELEKSGAEVLVVTPADLDGLAATLRPRRG